MTPLFRNLLLTIASGLLLAHSVISHRHQEVTQLSISADKSVELQLFDFIKIVISEDLGKNHLEDYQPTDNYTSVDFQGIIASKTTIQFISRDEIGTLRLKAFGDIAEALVQSDRTRGSPALA